MRYCRLQLVVQIHSDPEHQTSMFISNLLTYQEYSLILIDRGSLNYALLICTVFPSKGVLSRVYNISCPCTDDHHFCVSMTITSPLRSSEEPRHQGESQSETHLLYSTSTTYLLSAPLPTYSHLPSPTSSHGDHLIVSPFSN